VQHAHGGAVPFHGVTAQQSAYRPDVPAGHRPAERLAGLRCITGHVAPGRWDYVRHPSRKELAAARLLALSLDQASVKIRPAIPRSLPYRAC
jgi:hypothetical protein